MDKISKFQRACRRAAGRVIKEDECELHGSVIELDELGFMAGSVGGYGTASIEPTGVNSSPIFNEIDRNFGEVHTSSEKYGADTKMVYVGSPFVSGDGFQMSENGLREFDTHEYFEEIQRIVDIFDDEGFDVGISHEDGGVTHNVDYESKLDIDEQYINPEYVNDLDIVIEGR